MHDFIIIHVTIFFYTYVFFYQELKQVKLKMVKGNHFTMLQELSLTDYINKNIIHPPFYFI